MLQKGGAGLFLILPNAGLSLRETEGGLLWFLYIITLDYTILFKDNLYFLS